MINNKHDFSYYISVVLFVFFMNLEILLNVNIFENKKIGALYTKKTTGYIRTESQKT